MEVDVTLLAEAAEYTAYQCDTEHETPYPPDTKQEPPYLMVIFGHPYF